MSAATGARVALRTRSGLEAADLGFAMARAWWRPLAASWLAFVVPFCCVLVWLLRDAPGWAVVLLWWLRPAFARVPLFVLARELFAERASLGDVARALPRLLLGSGLFTSLVTRRLSVSRTFLQPVLQLEGLRRGARSARAAVLTRQDSGAALAALSVISLLGSSLMLGVLLLAVLLSPDPISLDVFAMLIGDEAVPGLVPVLYLIGISLAEPLLVAAGFGIYVNRRVFLEGWDIELAFRRLAARVEVTQRRRLFSAAAAAMLALWIAAPSARAADCVPSDVTTAGACIAEVLNTDDFGKERKEERWVQKEWETQQTDAPDLSWLARFAAFIARAAEILLYGGLAVGLVALLFSLRGVRIDLRRDSTPAFPRTFMGLDLDPDSLPADVVAAARALWQRGEAIAALSLLYRGALVRLGERGALEIPESATEFECLRMIRRTQAAAIAGSFGALTNAWIGARYAHEQPGHGEFEALCDGFGAFETASAKHAALASAKHAPASAERAALPPS